MSNEFSILQNKVNELAIFEIRDGVLAVDDNNRLIGCNPVCFNMFNQLDYNGIGMDLSETEEWSSILAHQESEFELNISRNGESRSYEIRRIPFYGQGIDPGYLFIIQDQTEKKNLLQALLEHSDYDSLTQIYNRSKLLKETEKELKRMKRYGNCLSVLMIDIDRLKFINEQFGYSAGDDIIKVLSDLCRERLRQTDIIGRYGGEEFLILLPETKEENALYVAEMLRKKINDTVFVSNQDSIHVTVSIGVKTVVREDEIYQVENLIRCTESALYYVKNHGRNQVSAKADLSPHSFLCISNAYNTSEED